MVLRTIILGGCASALVAGAAVAGTSSHPASAAPPAASASASSDDVSLASAEVGADNDSAATTGDAQVQALGRHRERLCARVPSAITRTQNLEKRLAAGPSTQGSLAYLQARIDAAEAAHHDRLVTTLKNRLAYRTELASFLPDRLQLLQKAQTTVCATSPSPSSSPSS